SVEGKMPFFYSPDGKYECSELPFMFAVPEHLQRRILTFVRKGAWVMRTFGVVLALTLFPGVMDGGEQQNPPEGWKEFSPRDKSFSVWLPDKGGRRSERERTLSVSGMRLKFNLVELQRNDGSTYSASTIIMPLQLTRKIPQQQRIEI